MDLELGGLLFMGFSDKLLDIRKQRGLTQQVLADTVGVHVTQLRRYEAGTSQPTVEVLRKLALALRTSADALLFDENERGPEDDFRLQFEAISRLDDREKEVVRELLEGMLIKHEADHWRRARQPATGAGSE
jgi:transcriptional regulator with XRE-family HTH domain